MTWGVAWSWLEASLPLVEGRKIAMLAATRPNRKRKDEGCAERS